MWKFKTTNEWVLVLRRPFKEIRGLSVAVLLEVCCLFLLAFAFQEKNKSTEKRTDPEIQKEKGSPKQNPPNTSEEKPKTLKKPTNPYGEWQEIKQESESQ